MTADASDGPGATTLIGLDKNSEQAIASGERCEMMRRYKLSASLAGQSSTSCPWRAPGHGAWVATIWAGSGVTGLGWGGYLRYRRVSISVEAPSSDMLRGTEQLRTDMRFEMGG